MITDETLNQALTESNEAKKEYMQGVLARGRELGYTDTQISEMITMSEEEKTQAISTANADPETNAAFLSFMELERNLHESYQEKATEYERLSVEHDKWDELLERLVDLENQLSEVEITDFESYGRIYDEYVLTQNKIKYVERHPEMITKIDSVTLSEELKKYDAIVEAEDAYYKRFGEKMTPIGENLDPRQREWYRQHGIEPLEKKEFETEAQRTWYERFGTELKAIDDPGLTNAERRWYEEWGMEAPTPEGKVEEPTETRVETETSTVETSEPASPEAVESTPESVTEEQNEPEVVEPVEDVITPTEPTATEVTTPEVTPTESVEEPQPEVVEEQPVPETQPENKEEAKPITVKGSKEAKMDSKTVGLFKKAWKKTKVPVIAGATILTAGWLVAQPLITVGTGLVIAGAGFAYAAGHAIWSLNGAKIKKYLNTKESTKVKGDRSISAVKEQANIIEEAYKTLENAKKEDVAITAVEDPTKVSRQEAIETLTDQKEQIEKLQQMAEEAPVVTGPRMG